MKKLILTHAGEQSAERGAMADSFKNTPVYQDVKAYFEQLFEARPERQIITLDVPTLVSDMEATFGEKYDARQIALLLANGFKGNDGIYVFRRRDFEVVKEREVANA